MVFAAAFSSSGPFGRATKSRRRVGVSPGPVAAYGPMIAIE
jgi:hypothetical protein